MAFMMWRLLFPTELSRKIYQRCIWRNCETRNQWIL